MTEKEKVCKYNRVLYLLCDKWVVYRSKIVVSVDLGSSNIGGMRAPSDWFSFINATVLAIDRKIV